MLIENLIAAEIGKKKSLHRDYFATFEGKVKNGK